MWGKPSGGNISSTSLLSVQTATAVKQFTKHAQEPAHCNRRALTVNNIYVTILSYLLMGGNRFGF